MCEKCLNEMKEQFDLLKTVSDDFVPRTVAFTNAMIEEQPDSGPPAMATALATALGGVIAKAPPGALPQILATVIDDIVAAMNAALPEDATVKVIDPRAGERPQYH